MVLATLCLLIPTLQDARADLGGRWQGRFEPPGHSAEVELELAHDGGAWRAELAFRAGAERNALPVDALAVDAATVAFETRIERAPVAVALALEDGLLVGTLRATEGGRVLAEGPAGLARAGDAAAAARLVRWLDAHAEPVSAELRARVVERAAALVEEAYVDAALAHAAAADVRARLARGEYDGVHAAARLAELLGRHLADATGDRHVRVRLASEPVLDPRDAPESTAEERAAERAAVAAAGGGVGDVRLLADGIGVLEMRRFLRAEHAGEHLAAAFARLDGARALVIDLRTSGGGDPDTVVLLASWLLDGTPRHWSDLERRLDGTRRALWTHAWVPGPRFPDAPVFVLTARATFSAPESLAFGLQRLGRATIVGERTGGGAHPGAWFPLAGRFALFVPLSRDTRGADWEGTGVLPDVACAAADALDVALAAARARLAAPR